jgi:hypothetical protein
VYGKDSVCCKCTFLVLLIAGSCAIVVVLAESRDCPTKPRASPAPISLHNLDGPCLWSVSGLADFISVLIHICQYVQQSVVPAQSRQASSDCARLFVLRVSWTIIAENSRLRLYDL